MSYLAIPENVTKREDIAAYLLAELLTKCLISEPKREFLYCWEEDTIRWLSEYRKANQCVMNWWASDRITVWEETGK